MLIATDAAVWSLEGAGDQGGPRERFAGGGVRQVAEGRRVGVVALAGADVVVLTAREPQTLGTGIGEPITSLLILEEEPLGVLIGTEGAHLYRLSAGQPPARRVGAFDALHCRSGWHTPWGGPPAVRSLAATPDGWVYADIHVGSIMRSPDRGATWEPVTPDLDVDVHQVATCPAAPDRVYANTARAVYVSEDRGTSWQHRAKGLGRRYGRALAVHPAEPDLLLATVSDGPQGKDVHAHLFRSGNAGRRWRHVTGGFPESAAENLDTFHVAFSDDGAAWALVDRSLYVGSDRATSWRPFWKAPDPIRMLACHR